MPETMPRQSFLPRVAQAVLSAVLAATSLVTHAGSNGLDLDRPMDEPTARAMLGRIGYGATPASLAEAERLTPRQYLQRAILEKSRLPASVVETVASLPVAEPAERIWTRLGPGGSARGAVVDEEGKKALQKEENRYASAAVEARLLAMANGDNPGHEALLSFWLNHFSIFAPKNSDKLLAWDYAASLEQAMAEDSFEALLRASFFHPAMQVYLDNVQSTAPNSMAALRAGERGKRLGINENLARELLELHTLGVDAGYTQSDVQELARIISGAGVWVPAMNEANLARANAVRRGLFLFDPRRHDYDEKRLLGTRFPSGQGIEEIDDALHLLALHPATAHRVAFKLAQRFLSDQPPPRLVNAMAEAYRRSNGRISATLMPLLASAAFENSLASGDKFKEPADYVISAARAACGDQPVGNGALLAGALMDMGEAPFMHTTPDGYGAQRADWLSPVAMAKRVRFAMGVAAERAPLAAPADDRVVRLRGDNPAKLLQGQPCRVDGATLTKLVGPLSPQTEEAAMGLGERERAALLLASPEFMKH